MKLNQIDIYSKVIKAISKVLPKKTLMSTTTHDLLIEFVNSLVNDNKEK